MARGLSPLQLRILEFLEQGILEFERKGLPRMFWGPHGPETHQKEFLASEYGWELAKGRFSRGIIGTQEYHEKRAALSSALRRLEQRGFAVRPSRGTMAITKQGLSALRRRQQAEQRKSEREKRKRLLEVEILDPEAAERLFKSKFDKPQQGKKPQAIDVEAEPLND